MTEGAGGDKGGSGKGEVMEGEAAEGESGRGVNGKGKVAGADMAKGAVEVEEEEEIQNSQSEKEKGGEGEELGGEVKMFDSDRLAIREEAVEDLDGGTVVGGAGGVEGGKAKKSSKKNLISTLPWPLA